MKRNFIIFLLLTLCVFSAVSNSNLSKVRNNAEQHTATLLDSILNYGLGFMGTPYHFGSSGPKSFDCSGFTSYIYRHFGYDLEHDSRHQARNTRSVKKSDLQKGDLVFFTSRRSGGTVGHVGIVLEKLENGEFRFIHASTNQGVTISSSEQPYYAARFVQGGRIVDYDITPLDNSPLYAQEQTKNTNSLSKNKDEFQEDEDDEYHIVKRGESLNEIAEKYDVPVITLKQMNGLKSNRIKKGMKLKISEEETQDIAQNEETDNTSAENNLTSKTTVPVIISEKTSLKHVVQKGETLSIIAQNNNTTIDELKQLNNLKSNNLSIGKTLVINKTENLATNDIELAQTSALKPDVSESSNSELVSKLKELSKKNTVKEKYNEPKKEIVEKVSYTKPLKHKVKKGETLSAIANNNNISLTELKRLNHLSSTKIKPGKELIVKEGKRIVTKEKIKLVAPAENSPQITETPKEQTVEQKPVQLNSEKNIAGNKTLKYKVQKGETLYDIARRNNISVKELKELNSLSSDKLQLGQILKVQKGENNSLSEQKTPHKKQKEKSGITTHIVKSGESLFSIRRKYNCKLEQLKKWNNLKDEHLQIGQKLILYQ